MDTAAPPRLDARTRALLSAGTLAGLLVAAVSWTLALLRPGFDVRRHANSMLALGDWGWVQTLNFITFGVLVTGAAVGVARATAPSKAGRGAAVGMWLYGASSVVVGVNPADPQLGFPPGSRPDFPGYAEVSVAARVHGVSGAIGFTAMTVACFLFARYFARGGRRGWAAASAGTGTAVIAVVVHLAANSAIPTTHYNYIPTWAVGTALWLYVSAVCAHLVRDGSR
ncbi:hypothetical protein MINS_06510 [Mycolicibacterium insubricum]|uniref:Uncharacterized protein n=1 Tax=Mycolicibacterium insubricum TaxID=444597 RepID=A0A1X0D886_9MYCO|nr:DUF998 domain-containing protein [Mycolicibacterium insubricum]MCB9439503.1 DUF998 domain-containing protein [Mycolicibacterium sp.]MCV7080310.1 DUF998 domain-containing protein [Mycolicibacterium insubricum]ORA68603.1 hypothetical protein BST26_14280 [Mycolicibacterium insubricum]BBZ65222.1 hypothetical protein MINS_06510 [Mycolicibacterium insubricum]